MRSLASLLNVIIYKAYQIRGRLRARADLAQRDNQEYTISSIPCGVGVAWHSQLTPVHPEPDRNDQGDRSCLRNPAPHD